MRQSDKWKCVKLNFTIISSCNCCTLHYTASLRRLSIRIRLVFGNYKHLRNRFYPLLNWTTVITGTQLIHLRKHSYSFSCLLNQWICKILQFLNFHKSHQFLLGKRKPKKPLKYFIQIMNGQMIDLVILQGHFCAKTEWNLVNIYLPLYKAAYYSFRQKFPEKFPVMACQIFLSASFFKNFERFLRARLYLRTNPDLY